MSRKVFVSYHLKDQRAGKWVTSFLRGQNIPYTGMEEDYDQCDTFVAIVSYRYLAAQETCSLLQLAVADRKRMVLLMIDEELAISYGSGFEVILNLAFMFGGGRQRKIFQSIMREIDLANIPYFRSEMDTLYHAAAYEFWQAETKLNTPLWIRVLGFLTKTAPSGNPDSFSPYGEVRRLYDFLTGAFAAGSLPEAQDLPLLPEEKLPSPAMPLSETSEKRRIPSLIRESTGDIIELPEGIFYIGSDPLNCGYCLEMPDVRDRHLAFRTELQTSYVSEADIEMAGERPLSHGDLITVGEEQFIFRYL